MGESVARWASVRPPIDGWVSMVENNRGSWVKHSDYAALEARCNELEAKLSIQRENNAEILKRAHTAENAIEEAPHDKCCWTQRMLVGTQRHLRNQPGCNCFKSKVKASPAD